MVIFQLLSSLFVCVFVCSVWMFVDVGGLKNTVHALLVSVWARMCVRVCACVYMHVRVLHKDVHCHVGVVCQLYSL